MAPTFESLQAIVREAGFTPSAASWEDSEWILVFSRETTPGTFGHPAFETSYNKTSRWLKIDGEATRQLS